MPAPTPQPASELDTIDLSDLLGRLRRGCFRSIGLAMIGLSVGLVFSLLVVGKQTAVTDMRVTFGFPGFERGTYPNGAKFQPDDLRAPDIVNEAVRRLGLQDKGAEVTSKIRGAIGISGFVSPNLIKERDRLRASGQTLAPYFPDEYEISLSLPRSHAVEVRQRELLLAEIVKVYLEKFHRSYVMLPPEFDNAFTSLKNADFVEYELILTKELQALASYLGQRIDNDQESNLLQQGKEAQARVAAAKQFRSPTNNLSFRDLLKQTELFTQIRLNDVLSQIYVNGLSKDRNHALVKMEYHLQTLTDREQQLKEEEAVILELLRKTQDRGQNYVLATKAQNPQGTQPLMDQAFIDSLLANDAYNFLVRQALDAGLAVKRVQADKARLQERRARMESFSKGETQVQATTVAQTQKALIALEVAYQELLSRVRTVLDDYARQEYADAVRISMQARTSSVLEVMAIAGLIGFGIGLSLGVGLSLLGVSVNRQPARG